MEVTRNAACYILHPGQRGLQLRSADGRFFYCGNLCLVAHRIFGEDEGDKSYTLDIR